jgi:hypothetical protein
MNRLVLLPLTSHRLASLRHLWFVDAARLRLKLQLDFDFSDSDVDFAVPLAFDDSVLDID